MRLEGPHDFSNEERVAMLDHPAILAKAIEVMGSRTAALEWMNRPAMGLDRQRPASLIRTADGVQTVEDFLVRLYHGVYS